MAKSSTKYESKSWLKGYLTDTEKQKWRNEVTRERSLVSEEQRGQSVKAGISQLNIKAQEAISEPEIEETLTQRKRFLLDTEDERYQKDLEEKFNFNIKHPFYTEVLSRYGMPDFTKTIKMTQSQKALKLTDQIKSTDGKSTEEKINPLFMQLGIVDVKKTVYKYKVTDRERNPAGYEESNLVGGNDVGGYEIIVTPREYEVIGENANNYYYMQDGKLVSLAKTEVTEEKPDAKMLENMWKESVNKIIETVRETTTDEEMAMVEEQKVYGTEKLEDDLLVLDRNGIDSSAWTPAQIRKQANIERQKEKPWLERIGEAEGILGTLDEIRKPFGGQVAERTSEAIPQVASGLGLPEDPQDAGAIGNLVSDILGYGLGLSAPIGAPGESIGSAASQLGTKAVAGSLGQRAAKFFRTTPAQKMLNNTVISNVAKGAAEGALSAPPITAYEAVSRDESLISKETLKRGVQEAGVGAVLGGALAGAGEAIRVKGEKKAKKARAERVSKIGEKVEEIKKKAKEKAEKTEETKAKTEKTKKSKYDLEEYKKKYELDKEPTPRKVKEVINRVLKDTGEKVRNKTGTNKPREILDHYKKKYPKELENVKMQATLKAEGTYGKTVEKDGKFIIKYNPNKDPDIVAGTIRHEIEHIRDKLKGFKSTDRTVNKEAKTIYDAYASKTHHEADEFFEVGYIRRNEVKEALDSGKLKKDDIPKAVLEELKLEDYEANINTNISGRKTVGAGQEAVPDQGIPGKGLTTTGKGKKLKGGKGIRQPKGPEMPRGYDAGDYTKESRFKGVTVKEGEGTTEGFRKTLKEGPPTLYDVASNADDWSRAIKKVNKSAEDTWARINKSSTGKPASSQDMADMMALVKYHQTNKNHEAAAEVLDRLTKVGTTSGQMIQVLSLWNKTTPEGVLVYAKQKVNKGKAFEGMTAKEAQIQKEIKDLRDTIKNLEKDSDEWTRHMKILSGKEKSLEAIQKKIAKADLSPSDSAYITERMTNHTSEAFRKKHYDSKLKELTGGNVRNATDKQKFKASEWATRKQDIELRRALTRIAELEPTTWREKLRAIQRINLLTNAKTVLRNNISNAVFGAVEQIRENSIGAFVDYVSSAVRSKSLTAPIKTPKAAGRTTMFMPVKKAKAYIKGLKKGTGDLAQDVYDSLFVYHEHISTSQTRGQFESPQRKVFKGTTPIGSTLNKLDNFVRTLVTDRPFFEAAKQTRITELKKLGYTGVEAEENAILYALDKVFQNDSAISKGMSQIRRFPLMELVLPFVQTPGNVLSKLIDYSGGGLAKFLVQVGRSGKTEFNAKQATDNLSRSLSGFGIAAVAWALAKNKLITGSQYAEKNYKRREYKLQKGAKNYSLKVNGKYYSYDWLTPVGGLMSAVADLVNTSGEKDAWNVIQTLAGTPINTIANQSFMEGLFQLFSEDTLTEGVLKGAAGATGQFVPFSTLTRQVATFTDQPDRITKDQNVIKSGLKRAQKGIPEYRKQLEPKIDLFGKEVSYKTGNTMMDFLNTFLVPSNIGTEKNTQITKEIDRLVRTNKGKSDTDIYPSRVSDTIRYNKKDYQLKPSQHTKYKKIYGQLLTQELGKLINSSDYRGKDPGEQYNMMKDVYGEVYDEAKVKTLKSLGYSVDEDE